MNIFVAYCNTSAVHLNTTAKEHNQDEIRSGAL